MKFRKYGQLSMGTEETSYVHGHIYLFILIQLRKIMSQNSKKKKIEICAPSWP